MITGKTKLIAHVGYPTESFRAPMIYNPYFKKHVIDAVVVPMGCRAEDYSQFLPLLFRLSNIHGALITMPHKVTTLDLLDEVMTTAKIAGSCNAIRLTPEGKLIGDMFDGEGFVRGLLRKGCVLDGARVFVAGCGGVGSAIAASLAKAGVSHLRLYDAYAPIMHGLADRLKMHYPSLTLELGENDPSAMDVVVNATPLGMKEGAPLPMDVSRIGPDTFVGEVVMKQEITPFLQAVIDKGCRYQIGSDMLFEQIPAYLEFFGFRTTTPDELRDVAELSY